MKTSVSYELMELRQTELFWPADNYSVRTGKIEPALHDVSRPDRSLGVTTGVRNTAANSRSFRNWRFGR